MSTGPYVVASIRPGGRIAEIRAGDLVLELELLCPESRLAAVERIAARYGLARATAERQLEDSVADAAFPPIVLEEDSSNGNGNGFSPASAPMRIGRHREWPSAPRAAAFSGLAGELVSAVDPYTEADRAAVLIHALVGFGNAVGASPHVGVGSERHPARLFAAVVGSSSKARKGTSWSPVRHLLHLADENWARERIKGGLSSGEGLIAAVRDAREVEEEDQRTGKLKARVVDVGVTDKRLLVIESELGRSLRVAQRQGNTLSTVVRQAWDNGDLAVMTKEAVSATAAHISIVGHITVEELRRELNAVESTNGFANRILWVPARRSKLLPDPLPFEGPDLDRLAAALAKAMRLGRERGRVDRDPRATDLWCDMYPTLSAERPGLVGSLLARSEAQVVRLSLCYALLAGSPRIRVEHLEAAVALWEFCQRGVEFLFGDATGDPVADTILRALLEHPQQELTRTEIRDLFLRHEDQRSINLALALVEDSGQAHRGRRRPEGRRGRDVEVWRAGPAEAR